QPQRQSDVPPQLIGSSLSPLHGQAQLAMVGEAGIVLKTRDLKWPQRNFPLAQVNLRGRRALRLKHRSHDALYTRNAAGSGVNRTQINGLAKREVIRIENSLCAIRQNPAAQNLQ